MPYVDGFVLVVPKKNLALYKKMAMTAGKIWKKHGALEFHECVGDDMKSDFGVPFPKLAKTKPSEVVLFSWIVFKSKTHRDAVNKKVMKDPDLDCGMDGKTMPFDVKRMSYGGFKSIVDL